MGKTTKWRRHYSWLLLQVTQLTPCHVLSSMSSDLSNYLYSHVSSSLSSHVSSHVSSNVSNYLYSHVTSSLSSHVSSNVSNYLYSHVSSCVSNHVSSNVSPGFLRHFLSQNLRSALVNSHFYHKRLSITTLSSHTYISFT